ncbi:MAG: hypothetical protein E6G84_03605 [Alphaproteobacteria bacterium]|nr:MAG: hypothetical protein E6G84_03605 [Alphaproteobacteria bacterium]
MRARSVPGCADRARGAHRRDRARPIDRPRSRPPQCRTRPGSGERPVRRRSAIGRDRSREKPTEAAVRRELPIAKSQA